MRQLLSGLLFFALILAGCAPRALEPEQPTRPRLALAEGVTLPPIAGMDLVALPDPVGAVERGEATAAVLWVGPGTGALERVTSLPTGYHSFPLQVEEQVILQAWLDRPLSLTSAEASALLATLDSPGEPRKGAVAKGHLGDLRPGWRLVPVDGIIPTPESLWSGAYPLANRLSLIYPSGEEATLAPLRGLRTGGLSPGVSTTGQTGARADQEWARLSVAGDFMLARGVARAMREKGLLYPVERVKAHLAAADLAFANLESPMGTKGHPLPGKQIWFQAVPEAVEVLKAAGLDGVTVANNHIMDYDEESFLETLEILETAGIPWTGGGRNLTEARQPLVLEARGVRIAFLGYSEFADLFFDWDYPRTFAATEDRPGVAGIQEEWLAADIQKARSMADLVAVTLHWGVEFQNYPTEEQRRLAHFMVDQGADLVLGYHPHAIQGFELYKGKLIAYSLGNFIMDRQDTDLARESMLLDFLISKDGVKQVEVRPVWIQAEQPYIMDEDEGAWLRAKMQEISGWQ